MELSGVLGVRRVPVQVADSLQAALADSRWVFISVTAQAHASLARLMAPFAEGRVFVLLPGRTLGAYTFWRGQPLKVLRAAPLGQRPAVAPGTVWELRDAPERGVAVAAGEGSLLLREVALAGRRPMPATAFVQGYRDFVGARLGA